MTADFNSVITTEAYTALLQNITDLFDAVSQGLDPSAVTPVNAPVNALRWELTTNKRLEKFNGTSWGSAEPAGGYGINISGSSSKWATGRVIALDGAVTATSGAFDGSGNLTITTTLATVAANKGGTGQTSYAVGDLLFASGATALSKLAAIASGNVLRSGGVGAAPAWGKVALGTDVSGTLGIANGGTGASTAEGARAALGVDIAMPSGTRMLFNQTTAPTGWTKDTTAALDDTALRITTGAVGSGGSVAFGTAFASQSVVGTVNSGGASTSGATTISTAQMPAHTHGYESSNTSAGSGLFRSTYNTAITKTSVSTGGGGSHTHSTPNHTHTFTGTEIDLAVKYVDFIIASKD